MSGGTLYYMWALWDAEDRWEMEICFRTNVDPLEGEDMYEYLNLTIKYLMGKDDSNLIWSFADQDVKKGALRMAILLGKLKNPNLDDQTALKIANSTGEVIQWVDYALSGDSGMDRVIPAIQEWMDKYPPGCFGIEERS